MMWILLLHPDAVGIILDAIVLVSRHMEVSRVICALACIYFLLLSLQRSNLTPAYPSATKQTIHQTR